MNSQRLPFYQCSQRTAYIVLGLQPIQGSRTFVELKFHLAKNRMHIKGISMRPHHFVLILVCIATYLLVFDSVLSLPRFNKQLNEKPETPVTVPWTGS